MNENIAFGIWTWGLALIIVLFALKGCQIERDNEYRMEILKAAKSCVAEGEK